MGISAFVTTGEWAGGLVSQNKNIFFDRFSDDGCTLLHQSVSLSLAEYIL
jgi:hypothetical protein